MTDELDVVKTQGTPHDSDNKRPRTLTPKRRDDQLLRGQPSWTDRLDEVQKDEAQPRAGKKESA